MKILSNIIFLFALLLIAWYEYKAYRQRQLNERLAKATQRAKRAADIRANGFAPARTLKDSSKL